MSQGPLTSTIVDDHGALVTWAMRKLHVPSDQREDARQGGALGLLVAQQRHDPHRGPFRNFAGGHVLHEIRTAVGWNRRQRVALVGLDTPEVAARVHHEDSVDRAERSDAIAAARRFISELDPAERDLVRRIYAEGATQTEIAAEMGTTKMTISRRLAGIHAKARRTLAAFADAA